MPWKVSDVDKYNKGLSDSYSGSPLWTNPWQLRQRVVRLPRVSPMQREHSA